MSTSGNHDNLILKEAAADYKPAVDGDVDLELLKDNLTKTAWERMQANDDALNFAGSLRAAFAAGSVKQICCAFRMRSRLCPCN